MKAFPSSGSRPLRAVTLAQGAERSGTCCGAGSLPATPAAPVPVRNTTALLTGKDIRGGWKVRWGFGRDRYSVEPGLYALGSPGTASPVMVTANYKLSFDTLRSSLPGNDAWLLVLDTRGINVWCAAGKGTFGTAELVSRIRLSGLASRVEHREVIVPQLGATGVCARQVREQSGFKVIFGPVRAADLPAFLAAGKQAAPEMRRVTFGFRDRLVLVPLELIQALKLLIPVLAWPLLFRLPGGAAALFSRPGEYLFFAGSVAAGSVAVPLLLPWIPGRAFSLKGWLAGVIYVLVLGPLFLPALPAGIAGLGVYLLVLPPAVSWLALHFTGATTFTSLSGVRREMRRALPLILLSLVSGLGLNLVRLFSGGLS